MNTIIIGGSGSLGKELCKKYSSQERVITYNNNFIEGGIKYNAITMDLEKTISDLGRFDHAILLLADKDPNSCYKNKEYSNKLNVESIKRILHHLKKQYRLLINDLSYEVPGGKVDKGEHPEQTAIRECFEETGVRCSNLKPLITYDPDLEYTRNHTHVFYSHDTEDTQTQLSGKHKWLPFNDCIKNIN